MLFRSRDGKVSQGDYKHILMHLISLHDEVKGLTAASKLDSSWGFLTQLREAGRRATRNWLASNLHEVGKTSTFDIWHYTSAAEGMPAQSIGEALKR